MNAARLTPRLPAQRSRGAMFVVLAMHVAFGWLLLHAAPMPRTGLMVSEPLRVSLVAAPAAPPPLEPPLQRARPQAPPNLPYVPLPEVTFAPPAEPAIRVAPAPSPLAKEVPPVTIALAPAPAASAAIATPKTIAPSAVHYLVPPAPAYPLASRRLRETGTVLLRVLVDDAGRPAQVQLAQSSGHPRLDEAAIDAMRHARFKPYSEGGVAQAVWAPAPIEFVL